MPDRVKNRIEKNVKFKCKEKDPRDTNGEKSLEYSISIRTIPLLEKS